jgi:hypothetical protein
MGQSYITKYLCWNDMCNAILENEYEADSHCRKDEPMEVYFCEVCDFQTFDNTEAAMDCEHHK